MNDQPHEQLHKALTQFSSAVFTMQSADDLERLVVAMWVELSTLGLNVRYCGINILDIDRRMLSFYGVHEGGLLVAEQIPFDCGFMADVHLDAQGALKPHLEGEVWRYALKVSKFLEWLERIRKLGIPVKGPNPQFRLENSEVLEVPFNFGTVLLAREAELPFDERTIEIAQRFAQTLSFGYARYLDLKKLELQNHELKVGLAADRLQAEVLAMKESGDWGKIVYVMYCELQGLGMRFTGCSINIIDEELQTFRQHIVIPSKVRKTYRPNHPHQSLDSNTDLFIVERAMIPGKVPSDACMEAWHKHEILRRVVDGSERQKVAERSRQALNFESAPADEYPRLLLDVPFSHGMIALGAAEPDDLPEGGVRILQQMAQAISLGYARFLDMQALEKRNRELQETQAQLVQAAKLAAMGQLVAGVAHEINTPLGTINSNLDVTTRVLSKIQKRIQKLDDEEGSHLLKLIQMVNPLMEINRQACSRIIRIVRDLKNFARLDEAEFKMANLNEDLDSTLTLIQHELKNRIQVVKEYSDLPLLRCYPNRLNQVFMNLLINACQSIQGRGQIRIETGVEDQHIRISISDTGVGIRKEHLEKIFDPGFTTKGVGVGTGLGLAISARIIQDHRGRIVVESEVGKGTTFTVILPLDSH